MLKNFIKDSLIYTIPSIVSRGLSLFLIPLYTRVLSPDDYGALDLFMVFVNIVNLTIALEISQGVARFYSSEKDLFKKVSYASTAFWFTFSCYLFFVISIFLFVEPISVMVMGRKGLDIIFKIGLLHILLYGLFSLMQNQLRWELRSKAYGILSLVYTLGTAGLSIWMAYIENLGLVGLMWGMVGGGLIAVLFGSWQLRYSFRFLFNSALLGEMLRFSAPLVPSAIAVWVSSYMDRLMIKHFLSLEEVGLYGIGFRLSSMVTLVMIGFQMALSPLIYSNYEKTETPGEIARIFRFFNALCLLVFAGINLFAEDLLIFFTQPLYFDARKVIIFLVPSIMLSQMYVFAPGIFIKKKSGYVIWINVVGACLNAILNWFMIPWLGFTGAAIATMISQIFVFSIYMYFSQLFYNVPHQWRKHFVASVLVVSIVLLAYPLSLSGIWHWIYCFVALLLTFLAFVVSGLVSASEINEFYIKVKTSKWFKFLNDK